MPVIAFAGDADKTNPIQGGGAGYWHYTMHAAEQRWAALNGCTAAPTTRWVADGVYEERYTGCRTGADVAARITVGGGHAWVVDNDAMRSEEHTSELQSLMRLSYAVFCLKKKK